MDAEDAVDLTLPTDTAARAAGAVVTEVSDGRAVVRLTVTPEMLNGFGSCHGGHLFLLADIAFSYACNAGRPLNVAAAADIVFVRPAPLGAVLTATAARRLRFGREDREGLYDVQVRDADGEVVALFTGRAREVGSR